MLTYVQRRTFSITLHVLADRDTLLCNECLQPLENGTGYCLDCVVGAHWTCLQLKVSTTSAYGAYLCPECYSCSD